MPLQDGSTLPDEVFRRVCRNVMNKEEKGKRRTRATRFGRFKLRAELGRGAVAVVWRAYDPLLDREVALKILPPAQSRQIAQRLMREVRATGRLRHPGIVTVYEAGGIEGRPFIVMELVRGTPLNKLGKVTAGRVAEIAFCLAKSLEYAHGRSVIHRDLKPSNIIVNPEGQPIIVDFGLARTIGKDERMTSAGAILGTPGYMSPEQAGGSPSEVDARSDIYNLGVILYELLTGRLPFTGSTLPEVVRRILEEEPVPPGEVDPTIPPELEAITLRAMAKPPEERYASAADLGEDLQAYIEGRSTATETVLAVSASRARRRGRARRFSAVWLVPAVPVLAGLIWLATVVFGGPSNNPPPGRPPESPPVEPRTYHKPPRGDPPRPRGPGRKVKRRPWLPALAAVRRGRNDDFEEEMEKTRTVVNDHLKSRPDTISPYIALSRLSLLRGDRAGAIKNLEEAIRAGIPEGEVRAIQCGTALATSTRFRFVDRAVHIGVSRLPEDELVKSTWENLRADSGSQFARAVRLLLEKRFDDILRDFHRRGRPFPAPEMNLIVGIALYNRQRFPDAEICFLKMADYCPSKSVETMLALSQMAQFRARDARRALVEAARLGGPDFPVMSYLEGLCLLDMKRYKDAESRLSGFEEGTPKRLALGLLMLDQKKWDAALEHFKKCGDHYSALYHRACVRALRGDLAETVLDLLEKAVRQAKRTGTYNRHKLPYRREMIMRTPPLFILRSETFFKDEFLRSLRKDPETNRDLKKIAGR